MSRKYVAANQPSPVMGLNYNAGSGRLEACTPTRLRRSRADERAKEAKLVKTVMLPTQFAEGLTLFKMSDLNRSIPCYRSAYVVGLWAKRLHEASDYSRRKCLDIAAREYGFKNYKHYLDEYVYHNGGTPSENRRQEREENARQEYLIENCDKFNFDSPECNCKICKGLDYE